VMRSDGGVAGEIGYRFTLAAPDAIEARQEFEQDVADDILAILKRGGCAEAPANDPLHQRLGDFKYEALRGAGIGAMRNFGQRKFGRTVISAVRPLP